MTGGAPHDPSFPFSVDVDLVGRPRRTWGAVLASAASVIAVVSLTAGGYGSVVAQSAGAAHPGSDGQRGDVIANLWEWNWPSVARECTDVLGPNGYGGVQVAPPQDSLSKLDDPAVVHPWWEVYQPVDYNLTSRMGNEAQFQAMVRNCRHAGVKVYVDAVINHMTGQGDISYGGVSYTKYNYTGLYSSDDFHHSPTDCPTAGGIDDFNNYLRVTDCELVGLSDLRTESAKVRTTIAGYLNKLLGYGVSGFRVDAAKHIGQVDLAGIEGLLHRTVDGTKPYVALEVFPGGPGKLAPQAFEKVGDLLGFDFAYQVKNAFKSYPTGATGNITDLQSFGEDAGLLPADKTLVFVENHDTERGSDTLSYKDGATNVLATEFMLARGYGTPEVYSSFDFTTNDASPPADANGYITDTTCDAGWSCTDRVTGVANMVGWHNYLGDAALGNWYDDGVNLIAFSRGTKGWIALNNSATAQIHTFTTGLRRGTHCDLIHGTMTGGTCTGPTVTVDARGTATVTVPAKDAVAINTKVLVRHG